MFDKLIHNINRLLRGINSLFKDKSKPFVIAGRALMATILGLCLSLVLVDALTLSTTAMFSSAEKRDFRMSDLFAQIADSRPVRKFEDRIIILNIGRAERQEIAEALSLLSLCGPKVVGLDINFAEPGDDDSFLIQALASLPHPVLPLGVGSLKNGLFEIDDKPFFYNELPGINYGIVNLPMTVNKGTVREYAIKFQTVEGEKPSFVAAVAEATDPQVTDNLMKKYSQTGITHYHSKEYRILNLDQIEENAEEFTDKIVLVGALEDASDIYSTPISSHVPGILIHAAALSTVLDGEWFIHIPKIADYLIAGLLCFLFMLISYRFKNNLKGLTLRLLQGLLVVLAVRIGYGLFIDHNIIVDVSYTLLILTFGFLAADIWNGIETLWKLLCNKIEKLDYNL